LRRRGLGFPLRLFDVLRGIEHVLIAHVAEADASEKDDRPRGSGARDSVATWMSPADRRGDGGRGGAKFPRCLMLP
jgi:hypothetical protein